MNTETDKDSYTHLNECDSWLDLNALRRPATAHRLTSRELASP